MQTHRFGKRAMWASCCCSSLENRPRRSRVMSAQAPSSKILPTDSLAGPIAVTQDVALLVKRVHNFHLREKAKKSCIKIARSHDRTAEATMLSLSTVKKIWVTPTEHFRSPTDPILKPRPSHVPDNIYTLIRAVIHGFYDDDHAYQPFPKFMIAFETFWTALNCNTTGDDRRHTS